MNLQFRDLRADEIECRVSTCSIKGVSLLLYKDARCDMNILDETVGAMNWQRRHLRDNANCIVEIYDEEKGQWVAKEDTGKESYTEKEKGLASDSFKRACFNWGIGRELYTAPFIWVPADKVEIKENPKSKGSYMTRDRFLVSEIQIEEKKITGLCIVNERTGEEVFRFPHQGRKGPLPAKRDRPSGKAPEEKGGQEGQEGNPRLQSARRYIDQHGLREDVICSLYKVSGLAELSEKQIQNVLDEKYLGYWKQKCGVE